MLAAIGFDLLAAGVIGHVALAGDDGFQRPWSGVLGDARWLSMRDARQLFPEDGDIVIGEAYRPDIGRRRFQEFLPTDKRTWGRGGQAKVLAYKMDFDSTHTLFFAGSGGFKTTSTVIPTALRYPGSMVV